MKLQEAVAVVKDALRELPNRSADIAVQLYNEGVRKAKCGDAERCAIAQYLANQLPKGFTVSVGDGADVADKQGNEAHISFKSAVDSFIMDFDQHEYGFLVAAR